MGFEPRAFHFHGGHSTELPSYTLLINFSPYLCTRLHYVHIYVTLLAVMAISQIKTSQLLITSFQQKKIIQSNWQKFNNNNFLQRCEKQHNLPERLENIYKYSQNTILNHHQIQ